MNIKEFINKEIIKLHKKTLLESEKNEIENQLKLLKEYNNYDYPAGADADPSAPWNQVENDYPKFDDFEIEEDGDTLETFYIKAIGNDGDSYASDSLLNILGGLEVGEEVVQYFEKSLIEKGDEGDPSPELHTKLTNIIGKWFERVANVQWEEREAPEPDFNTDDN